MLKKVGILANGGDVSGFNAVIRAIVKTAENHGVECYGIIDGYNGLLKKILNYYQQQQMEKQWEYCQKEDLLLAHQPMPTCFITKW